MPSAHLADKELLYLGEGSGDQCDVLTHVMYGLSCKCVIARNPLACVAIVTALASKDRWKKVSRVFHAHTC